MKNKNYYPSGVYAIHNITKDIFYIGSSENIEKRFYQHIQQLKTGKHYNKNMQNDFAAGDVFVFGCIKDTYPDHRQLLYEESYYINQWKKKNIKLYNNAIMNGSYYMNRINLKDVIVNKYLMQRYGKTYDQMFPCYDPVKIAMYYDIFNTEPEKENEIKESYQELHNYFNSWIFSARKEEKENN